MILEPLPIEGAWLVTGHRHADERGSFTRVANLQELGKPAAGLATGQLSFAANLQAATVRGLHYQVPPHAETKLIWCVSGRAYDVLVDVRSESPHYGQHCAIELAEDVPLAVLVGPGIAHGYQTLDPGTVLGYLIDAPYHAPSARTVLWKDPTLAIGWPLPAGPISERDARAEPWPPAS